MQSITNQLIRMVFRLVVSIPFNLFRWIVRLAPKEIKIPISGAETEGSQYYTSEPLSPNSKQGRLDRRNYERLLDVWSENLDAIEELAFMIPNADESVAPETIEQAQHTIKETIESLYVPEQGVVWKLDVLEHRNTGMAELKRRRKALEDRQATIAGVGLG